MRRRLGWLVVAVLALVLASNASAHRAMRHQAARPHITLLFSIPAQHHPKPHAPPKPIIECQVSDGGAYRVCCIWNPNESPYMPGVGVLPIIGAWDCTSAIEPPN